MLWHHTSCLIIIIVVIVIMIELFFYCEVYWTHVIVVSIVLCIRVIAC